MYPRTKPDKLIESYHGIQHSDALPPPLSDSCHISSGLSIACISNRCTSTGLRSDMVDRGGLLGKVIEGKGSDGQSG